MQVTGQNVQQKSVQHPQYNSGSVYTPSVSTPTQLQSVSNNTPQQSVNLNTPQVQTVQQNNIPAQIPPQYNPQYCAPQYAQYPQMQAPQPVQNYQVPASTSGVNIQIFNPSVSTPGSQPATYNVNAPCYPANYYTGTIGQNTNNDGKKQTQDTNSEKNIETNTETKTDEKKKTEKKKIVQLTDDYIRNLESYLNSQEKQVRLSAAKEVYARLEEDESRKDDKALTALINKMLQDPDQEIRIIALAALDGRICTGDDFTIGVLKQMQQSKDGYGQDAVDASNILLKMSGKQVEKEVPVKENSKKTTTEKKEKKETKESSKG